MEGKESNRIFNQCTECGSVYGIEWFKHVNKRCYKCSSYSFGGWPILVGILTGILVHMWVWYGSAKYSNVSISDDWWMAPVFGLFLWGVSAGIKGSYISDKVKEMKVPPMTVYPFEHSSEIYLNRRNEILNNIKSSDYERFVNHTVFETGKSYFVLDELTAFVIHETGQEAIKFALKSFLWAYPDFDLNDYVQKHRIKYSCRGCCEEHNDFRHMSGNHVCKRCGAYQAKVGFEKPERTTVAKDLLLLLFERFNSACGEFLVRTLNQVDTKMASSVIRLIGFLEHKQALPVLVSILSTGDEKLIGASSRAISALGDKSAWNHLSTIYDRCNIKHQTDILAAMLNLDLGKTMAAFLPKYEDLPSDTAKVLEDKIKGVEHENVRDALNNTDVVDNKNIFKEDVLKASSVLENLYKEIESEKVKEKELKKKKQEQDIKAWVSRTAEAIWENVEMYHSSSDVATIYSIKGMIEYKVETALKNRASNNSSASLLLEISNINRERKEFIEALSYDFKN